MLEAREEVLIPLIDDEGISHILHGGKLIGGRLETAFMPDPELLIRTGGEVRVSNFLLWQIAYSELYCCDTYWPDFDEQDLHRAIASYQARQRRFGKTGGQIESGE